MSEKRALATIRKIDDVTDIFGSTGLSPDRIELVKIGGWSVVTAKENAFNKGDKVVFCEIDSQLPDKEWCAFMEPYGFKVKTREIIINTLKVHVYSQGVIFPLSILEGDRARYENEDVTEELGITLCEEEMDPTESPVAVQPNSRTRTPKKDRVWDKVYNWIVTHFPLGEKRKQALVNKIACTIPKTSLKRLQNYIEVYGNYGGPCEVTEKIDGTSFTAYDVKGVKGYHSKNRYRADPIYKIVYDKLDIADRLLLLKKITKSRDVYIQGEIVGRNMIGARYVQSTSGPSHRLFIYNIVADKVPIRGEKARDICAQIGLDYVPTVEYTMLDKPEIEDWMIICEGNCLLPRLGGILREGIVVKGLDERNRHISFKLISPKYSMQK